MKVRSFAAASALAAALLGLTAPAFADDVPPSSDPGAPVPVMKVVQNGATVNTDATGSQNTVFYEWNFGDGQGWGGGITDIAQYTKSGVYTITLKVWNAQSVTATASQTVVIPDLCVAPRIFPHLAVAKNKADIKLGNCRVGDAIVVNKAGKQVAPKKNVTITWDGPFVETSSRAIVKNAKGKVVGYKQVKHFRRVNAGSSLVPGGFSSNAVILAIIGRVP